jgi:hypothetical protein
VRRRVVVSIDSKSGSCSHNSHNSAKRPWFHMVHRCCKHNDRMGNNQSTMVAFPFTATRIRYGQYQLTVAGSVAFHCTLLRCQLSAHRSAGDTPAARVALHLDIVVSSSVGGRDMVAVSTCWPVAPPWELAVSRRRCEQGRWTADGMCSLSQMPRLNG